jgi:hypothetical protein
VPYNQNIPQPGDTLSASQPQILGNFAALSSFGNGYADFPTQGVAPTLGAGDTGFYTLNNADTTKDEMYIVKPSNDAPTDIPFTASKMSNSLMANCEEGWSYLPSGLLIKWGAIAITASGLVTINVPGVCGGPAFNKAFQVIISPFQTAGIAGTFAVVLTTGIPNALTGSFEVSAVNALVGPNTGFNFIVIGV